MKVALLSTYGQGGGAAIAAKRLMKALRSIGTEASMLVRTGQDYASHIHALHEGALQEPLFLFDKFYEKLKFLPHEKNKSVRFAFSTAQTGREISQHPLIQEADIIHLHWVQHGFLDMDALNKLSSLNKPIVWTLHDQWAFTGGCHYTRGCAHYEQKCGKCPMLKNPSDQDISRKLWQQKSHWLKQTQKLCVVACSDWLRKEALTSGLMKNSQVINIPNPADPEAYFPESISEARLALNIPEDRFVLLFVAQNIRDPRKGFVYLERALEQLKPEIASKITLLLMGKEGPEKLSVPYITTGPLSNLAEIRRAYNAADVLMVPSLEDNLPNTIMEASSCHKPSIAFRTGGIPEMIIHQETGWLSDSGYEYGLTEGIEWMTQENRARACGEKAGAFAQANYTPEIVAKQYLSVYEGMRA